jgi:Na+/H+ antiporter NhaD/arsenite permease-like protein
LNSALIAIFSITYAAIALEHPIKINKSASALAGAGLLWTIYAVVSGDTATIASQLDESVAATAQIVFFLMGAMAIVEVIDLHGGFEVVTSRIRTTRLTSLMWMVSGVTFFLSAILDNLTTTIVMVSLLRKLLEKESDRLLFAAIIVIAANAGGAWSPIGDITTTMLWIGGQLSPLAAISNVFVPSVVSLLVPLLVVNRRMRKQSFVLRGAASEGGDEITSPAERNFILYIGLGILVMVPAFKTVTHLPPFLGILFGLGILWIVGDILHRNKPREEKERLTLAHALLRIDLNSLVFFVGILLAVATLEHAHILAGLATWLGETIGRLDVIVLLFGLASAVVDNVPLVAASAGMYSLSQYPPDSFLWLFMAYCAGTGGSILIIGSAAGVAAMGIEKIPFFWYLKRISGLALLGYLAGAAAFILQYRLLHA